MSFPAPEDALRLHQRLLDDDPVAPGDVCHAFLEPLLHALRIRRPHADHDLLCSAVHQTLLDFVKHPGQYDPAHNPNLGAYLRMAADRDALNLMKQETRHHRRRETVELDSLAGNDSGEDGPALRLIRAEDDDERERIFEAVRREADAADRAVLQLLHDGVKANAAFAAALNVAHLPIEEQERIVKQAKDRVKKRMRRYKRHA